MVIASSNQDFKSGYSNVNGLNMYFEVYGQGFPLALIHGGGSTIQSTFGRVIPLLCKGRQLICVELQAHGRTGDRNGPISFEQDADDVAALLSNLNIKKADIFGFSNGGNTALQMAIRHPETCNRVVAASVLLKRSGAFPQFWEFMNNGNFEQMPYQYKDAFLAVNPNPQRLLNMYQKCSERIINLVDFPDSQLQSILCPVLLINGDRDVGTIGHIAAMSKLIPNCRVMVIPGGHGEYMGEITTLKPGVNKAENVVPLIGAFLNGE